MAELIIAQSTLQLVFEVDVNEFTGESIVKSKSFNNVKASVSAAQLLNVANAYGSLQQFPLAGVKRRDTADIVQS